MAWHIHPRWLRLVPGVCDRQYALIIVWATDELYFHWQSLCTWAYRYNDGKRAGEIKERGRQRQCIADGLVVLQQSGRGDPIERSAYLTLGGPFR